MTIIIGFLQHTQRLLEWLIGMSATGKSREKMTELNIELMILIEKYKKI